MRPLTPKQEKFANLYVELGDASKAYRGAYSTKNMKPATVNRCAHELLKNPNVAARIEEIRAELNERVQITLEGQFEKLQTIFENHNANPKGAGAAVSAVKHQSELAGLIVKKHKVEGDLVVQQLPPLSPKAALALKEKLEAERF